MHHCPQHKKKAAPPTEYSCTTTVAATSATSFTVRFTSFLTYALAARKRRRPRQNTIQNSPRRPHVHFTGVAWRETAQRTTASPLCACTQCMRP
jgi:hypothetical protein